MVNIEEIYPFQTVPSDRFGSSGPPGRAGKKGSPDTCRCLPIALCGAAGGDLIRYSSIH
jgi:hypothetical protein